MTSELDKLIAHKIAESTGGLYSSRDTLKLIENVRVAGLCMHGVKKYAKAELIKQEGIKPLTPEGGSVSFWSMGRYIFHAGQQPDLRYFGIDTPFFDYSFSKCGSEIMRVAAFTTTALLENNGIVVPEHHSADTQLQIKATIPPEILDVAVLRSSSIVESNQLLLQYTESLLDFI